MTAYLRLIVALLTPLLYLMVSYYYWPEFSLPLAVFLTIITFWIFEIFPLPITGLLAPCIIAITGIMPTNKVFAAFGDQVLFLFIGSFCLAAAMQKHGWDQRIALAILNSSVGKHSLRLLVSLVALICFALSMWISNTAACALMVPLCIGIINTITPQLTNQQQKSQLATHLILLCAYSASIGGIATPVGSPPNLLAINFLKQHDIFLSFFDWMLFGLPIGLLMLVVALFILQLLFPLPAVKINDLGTELAKKKASLGQVKTAEIQVAIVFSLAVMLWILPGITNHLYPEHQWNHWLQNHLPIGAVATLAASLLFVLPIKVGKEGQFNLTWQDAAKIDWGIICLFGGGLCLGAMLDHTGLAKAIASDLFPDNLTTLHILILVTVVAILMSEFSSNTAAAAILIPVVYNIPNAATLGLPLVLAVTLGASYGFMLPISTPPNAIAYGTGQIKLKQMITAGLIFDICGLFLIAGFVFVFWG